MDALVQRRCTLRRGSRPREALLLGQEDYILPCSCITQMGSDIILIDGKANIRRGRRDKNGMG